MNLEGHRASVLNERRGPFDQNSSVDELDRTLPTHRVQAHGNTLAGGAND